MILERYIIDGQNEAKQYVNLILSPVSDVQLHQWILSRTGRVNDLGNQREFRQLIPRKGLAVVIPIRMGNRAAVESILGEPSERYRFYIDLSPGGEPIHIPNLDGPDVTLPSQPFDCVTIQSGGKMWCGYEEFVERVRELAPFLSNSLFYVGDEEDYIDEFQIIDGMLKYSRVHSGFYIPVRNFLRSNGIRQTPNQHLQ